MDSETLVTVSEDIVGEGTNGVYSTTNIFARPGDGEALDGRQAPALAELEHGDIVKCVNVSEQREVVIRQGSLQSTQIEDESD